MSSQLRQRLVMSFLGILLLGSAVYVSFFPYFKLFFLLVSVSAAACALYEYYQLVENKGFQPLSTLGLSSTVAYFIAVFFERTQSLFGCASSPRITWNFIHRFPRLFQSSRKSP